MALRCFIAVEIPEQVKKGIGDVIGDLARSGADIKWVRSENIHITLKFLGGTEESLIGPVTEALSKKLSPYTPFYIKIAGVGCFPNEKRPRVIWVGIRESGPVTSLQEEVETVMQGFGFPAEERAFSPHLTIGRARSQKGIPQMLNTLNNYRSADFADMEVKGLSLMKSELKPAGAQYYRLAEIPFGGGNNVKQG